MSRLRRLIRLDELNASGDLSGLYGPELLTNRQFAADTDWTKGSGITISGGTANWSGTNANLIQTVMPTIVAGTAYRVWIRVTARTSGSVRAQMVGTTTVSGPVRSAVGFYSSVLICPASPTAFRFFGNTSPILSIDDVSLREVL